MCSLWYERPYWQSEYGGIQFMYEEEKTVDELELEIFGLLRCQDQLACLRQGAISAANCHGNISSIRNTMAGMRQ